MHRHEYLLAPCASSFHSTFKQDCFECRFSGLPDSSKVHLEQLMSRPTQNCYGVAGLFSDFMNNTPEVPTASQLARVERQLDPRPAANIHHSYSNLDHIEPYIGSLVEQLTEAPAPAYVTDTLASSCEPTTAPNMTTRTQRVGCNERRQILRGREQRNSMSLPESPASRKRACTSSNALHKAVVR